MSGTLPQRGCGRFFSNSRQRPALLATVITAPRTPRRRLLRYLQTLTTIAADKNSTIVFPLPVDLLNAVLDRFAPPRER